MSSRTDDVAYCPSLALKNESKLVYIHSINHYFHSVGNCLRVSLSVLKVPSLNIEKEESVLTCSLHDFS
jgi:hypothetical protein